MITGPVGVADAEVDDVLLTLLLPEITVLETELVDSEVELLSVEDDDTDVLLSVDDKDVDDVPPLEERDDALLVEIEVLESVLELTVVEDTTEDEEDELAPPGIESAPGTYFVRS